MHSNNCTYECILGQDKPSECYIDLSEYMGILMHAEYMYKTKLNPYRYTNVALCV